MDSSTSLAESACQASAASPPLGRRARESATRRQRTRRPALASSGGRACRQASTRSSQRAANTQPAGRFQGSTADAGDARGSDRPAIDPGNGLEEACACRVPWLAEQVVRGRVLDDPAAVEHDDAVGDVPHDGQVVGDVDDRHAEPLRQTADLVEEAGLRRHVEARRRLVHDDHVGLARRGPSRCTRAAAARRRAGADTAAGTRRRPAAGPAGSRGEPAPADRGRAAGGCRRSRRAAGRCGRPD